MTTLPTPDELAERVLPEPEIAEDRQGKLTFKWDRTGTSVTIVNLNRLQGAMVCEIIIRSDLFGPGVAPRRINLLSSSAVTQYIRELNDRYGDSDDWKRVMDHIGTLCWQRMERGTPGQWLGYDPARSSQKILVHPFIGASELSFLSADGGTGKTTLMTAMALGFKSGREIIPGFTSNHTGEVLYLDWESEAGRHRDVVSGILKGAGMEGENIQLRYMRCRGPLSDQIDNIRREVDSISAELIIIDSVSWAAGGDLMAQETVDKYEKAVSMLDGTTVGICHTPKNGSQDRPFGSAFWHDLARSSWMARQTQEEGDDRIHVGLWHKKANYRRKQLPVGVRIEFSADGSTRFHREAIASNFEGHLSLRQQITTVLGNGKSLTPKEIADELDIPGNRVRAELSRGNKIFRKSAGDRYSLLTDVEDTRHYPVPETGTISRNALQSSTQHSTPLKGVHVAGNKAQKLLIEEDEEKW